MAQNKRTAVNNASARHGKLRRSASWANALKVLVTMVIVTAISGISVAAYAALNLSAKAKTVSLGAVLPERVDADQATLDGELNILLVGSDTRAGQSIDDGESGELNDVNLLLHVPKDHQSATIISFPRDLMIPIPSCPSEDGEPEYYGAMSEQMLNSAMMYGGLPCVVMTISELTGFDIPYAAVVTFDGVINISNALGGVEVCLAQPIVDEKTDLDLPKGIVKLKGKKALQFLRTRAGVGDGSDTSRISNQQVFMSALLKQLQSKETLGDPLKVYNLAKTGFENLTMSESMASVSFMQALAGTVVDIDLERINFVQYPSGRHPYQSGRLTPNYEAAAEMLEVVKSGEPFVVTGKGLSVEKNKKKKTDSDSGDSGDSTTSTEETEPTKLPSSITGQSAADDTCSAGRTIY